MKISKRFNITLAHKFPNGDIVSIAFGTDYEIESILDNAPEDEVAKLDKSLAKQVYLATKKDIARAVKQDTLVREVWQGIQAAVKSQLDERDAEKVLDE